jgi:hypothetical protein
MKQAQGALFSALGEACNFITSENASQPEVSVIAAAPASPGTQKESRKRSRSR